MSQWDYGRPAPDHHDPRAGEYTDGFDDDGTSPYPITWERAPGSALQRIGLPEQDWPPRRQRGRRGGHRGGYRGGFLNGRARWLVLALVAVAGAGVAAGLVLTGGNPAGKASTRPSPAPLRVVPLSSGPAVLGRASMGLWPQRLGSFSAGLPLPEKLASTRGHQPPRDLSLERRIGRSAIRSLSSRHPPSAAQDCHHESAKS